MKTILTDQEIDRALTRLAHEMVERFPNGDFPAIVGIRTRGEYLARRISKKISQIIENKEDREISDIPFGILDINLYRDDLTRVALQPVVRETILEFELDDKAIILVDDVLYTGRTVRCALDAVMDLGRPKIIQLAVLIDRGHRELPIKADYVGKNIPTGDEDVVHVKLSEVDGEDEVVVEGRQ